MGKAQDRIEEIYRDKAKNGTIYDQEGDGFFQAQLDRLHRSIEAIINYLDEIVEKK